MANPNPNPNLNPNLNPMTAGTPSSALVASAVPTHDPAHEPELRAAADRVAPDLAAIAETEVEIINLDIPTIVGTAQKSWATLQPFMPALAALPGVPVDNIRKLADYAKALIYWQGSAMFATTPTSGVAEMVATALEKRERVLHDIGALVRHGILDAALVQNFGSSIAHRRIGLDLIGLSNLAHARWSDIRGKSLITLEDMDEALKLGGEIVRLCGDRDSAMNATADAVIQRDKAYTLLLRTYAEARSAMVFLRRAEGDADKLVPSFYAGRRPAKKHTDEGDSEEVVGAGVGLVSASIVTQPNAASVHSGILTPSTTTNPG